MCMAGEGFDLARCVLGCFLQYHVAPRPALLNVGCTPGSPRELSEIPVPRPQSSMIETESLRIGP